MIIDKRSRFFRPKIEFEENVAATGTKEEWKNIQLKNRTNRSSLHQAECKSDEFENHRRMLQKRS